MLITLVILNIGQNSYSQLKKCFGRFLFGFIDGCVGEFMCSLCLNISSEIVIFTGNEQYAC